MIIRDYQPVDYEQVVALWRNAGLPVKLSGRDAPAALERQLASSSVFLLVAAHDGGIVGAVLGSHDARKGWLNRLAVAREWRRAPLGVAARLIAGAEERFRALGLEIFACLVEDRNLPAMRFIQRLGYKPFAGISYFTKRLRPDV